MTATPAPDIALLFDAVSRLRLAGIRFWLSEGSLLGLVRNGQLIPWDLDIDFGVWAEEVDETCLLGAFAGGAYRADSRYIRGIESINFHPVGLATPRHIEIVSYAREARMAVHRTHYLVYPDRLRERGAAFAAECLRGEGCHLWPGRPIENDVKQVIYECFARFLQFRAARRVATKAVREWFARAPRVPLIYECPARFFDELEEHPLLGGLCPAPRDAEGYLAHLYGPDWRTPRRWVTWYESASRSGDAAR